MRTVKLPDKSSESSTDEDFEVPPPKATKFVPPQKEEPVNDPFEVKENEDAPVPEQNLDYPSLGLPPLSFVSDPFLSPIQHIQFAVKRHRIWIKGIKGVKFSCSINGTTVLVAKRKMHLMKKSWFISRSFDFSLDTPDLVGILTKQRSGLSYTLFSSKERQSDSFHQVLAGIILKDPKSIIIGDNIWIPPNNDDIFEKGLIQSYETQSLSPVMGSYKTQSVKNGTFVKDGQTCFNSEKQTKNAVLVDATAPLSLAQAFAISIALFIQ